MNEAVERAAKAMYDDNYEDGWPAAGPEMREHYVNLARIAVEALREPSEAMLEAAPPIAGENPSAEEVWQAMMDEAAR